MYRPNRRKFDPFFPKAIQLVIALLLAASLLASCDTKSDDVAETGNTEASPLPAVHTDVLDPDIFAAASHILVAWAGATDAPAEITRTKAEARSRAAQISFKAQDRGADFIELVHKYSDAEDIEDNDGYMGIFARGVMEMNFDMAVFDLPPGAISSYVETEWGYHIIKREVIQQARLRHILVSWKGASQQSSAVMRTKEEAASRANELHAEASRPGADFCKLVRQYSDDTSSRGNCGDLGIIYRGHLHPDIEATGFRLRVGSVGEPVETEFGYHIILRDEVGN